MTDQNPEQTLRKQRAPSISLLRIAQENQRRYRMKKISLIDLKHKVSANTLESADKDRKTHRDIRPEDKGAYDSQNEFLVGSPRNLRGAKWAFAVTSLASLSFMLGLDTTVTAVVQATFTSSFQSVNLLGFSSAAFFLGAATTALTWTQVYNAFDVKWVLVCSIVIFEVGSIISGAAPNSNALITGRAFSGVGGSGMAVGIWSMLLLTTTEEERSLYMRLPSLAWSIGIVLGSIIGGAFAEGSATWRWGYYIQLCIGTPKAAFRDRMANIDLIGTLLLTLTLLCLVLAVNFGGLTYSWNSGSVIVLFVLAGLFSLTFALQQISGWMTQQTVLPVAILKEAKMLPLFLLQACSATAFFVTCYFIPLYFQYVKNETPLRAGVHLLPLVVPTFAAAMISNQLLRRDRLLEPCLLIGSSLVLTGSSLMYNVDAYTETARIYGYTILIGAGAGPFIDTPLLACRTVVSPVFLLSAMAMMVFAQFVAPALALSIAFAAFLNTAQSEIQSMLPKDRPYQATSMIGGEARHYLGGLDVRTRHQIMRAIADTLAEPYALVIASGVLAVVAVSFLLWSRFTARAHH
ncbi:Phomenoic acid biosynthesis cluster MFS-type transporter [Pseudocercospora fuligena]|uniref:Phomenoic acid biosynthesis cluster MFS-type transporter n=1 Tax=Pseudocercospora fuligena TaxID=685502 RepID=A0A8H6VH57_9PEZI|nr:Phomenoic acid biosynthesis cluster MFS-type transporter [Pseudocercospora fuligena]